MSHDPLIVSLRKPDKGGAAHDDPAMTVSLRTAPTIKETPHSKEIMEPERTLEPARSVARVPSVLPKKRRRMPGFVAMLAGAVILAVGLGLYFSFQAHMRTNDPTHVTQADVDALVAHVGKLVLLPAGEEPTVATVTDLKALAGQEFFKNASLGDKVLMYPKAQEAVLYDPNQDKIIQVAPLMVGTQK